MGVEKQVGDPIAFENSLSHRQFQTSQDGIIPYAMQPKPNISRSRKSSLDPVDRPAFFLLLLLYMLQGIPVGLAMGSVPYILKSNLSYAQVGIFSIASYPYSLKLLWLPIVDAIYSPKIGRRKLWIIPVQAVSGLALLYLSGFIDLLLTDPLTHLASITCCFFTLVLFCATQDIAVDGWALTSLSSDSLSYASTAQTIGLNTGYFSSFTIFLSLSSPAFANKYLRSSPSDTPIITMGLYLKFWGVVFIITSGLLYFVPEDPPHLLKRNQAKLADEKAKYQTAYNPSSPTWWVELKGVYQAMYQVLKLPNIQVLVVILLLAKVGFSASESATNLRLLEKGFSKEDLSLTVLVNFPFELLFGYFAGGWLSGKRTLQPWLMGFAGRLLAAALAPILVYSFPMEKSEVGTGFFLLVVLHHLLCTFMATVQAVSLCAFFTRIADPAIGGTYMTTLNTISNYGGAWPRLIVLLSIDKFTQRSCSTLAGTLYVILSDADKKKCLDQSGTIKTVTDGYFFTNFMCVALGALVWLWVKRKATHLQALPNGAWRVAQAN